MPRVPNVFTNPVTGEQYQWPLNHSSEDPMAKSRQMADGAATSNIGLIPQQGASTPLILVWKGSILIKAQLQAMLHWWEICEDNSIYVSDPLGNEYEVLISDFQPQVKAVAQNRNDMVNAPFNIWEYTLTMRVLTALAGVWVGVTP